MGISDELEKLQALHDSGALSDEEFARAKARALASELADEPPQGSVWRRLVRSKKDRVFGGVCGGFGQISAVPSWGWRACFVLALLYFGAGLLLYIVLWLLMPQEP